MIAHSFTSTRAYNSKQLQAVPNILNIPAQHLDTGREDEDNNGKSSNPHEQPVLQNYDRALQAFGGRARAFGGLLFATIDQNRGVAGLYNSRCRTMIRTNAQHVTCER